MSRRRGVQHHNGGRAQMWQAHLRYCAHVAGVGRPTRHTLAVILSGFGGRGQPATPTQKTLAEWCGRSTRTVQRWVAEHRADGVLVVKRPPRKRDPYTGRWTSTVNRYHRQFAKTKRPGSGEKTWSHRDDKNGGCIPPTGSLTNSAPPVEHAQPPETPPPNAPTRPPTLQAGETLRDWMERHRCTPP